MRMSSFDAPSGTEEFSDQYAHARARARGAASNESRRRPTAFGIFTLGIGTKERSQENERMNASGLTSRQAAFVTQILLDPNGTKAAVAAGYSPRTAAAIATENLRKPEIASALAEARRQRAQRVRIEADAVLEQVYRMAMVDVREFVDAQNRLIPLRQLPDTAAAAIQSIEITERDGAITYRVRLADRVAAIDRLMRHLGLFEKDQRQQGGAVAELLGAIHAAGSRLPVRP